MDELTNRINNAKGLDDLLPLIDTLSRETEAILSARVVREGDFDRILHPLIVIRILLNKLDMMLPKGDGNAHAALIRKLTDRCLDLEGTMKETRNDRFRAKSAA